MFGLVNQVEYW